MEPVKSCNLTAEKGNLYYKKSRCSWLDSSGVLLTCESTSRDLITPLRRDSPLGRFHLIMIKRGIWTYGAPAEVEFGAF